MNGSTVSSSKARVLDALRGGMVRHRDMILLRAIPVALAAAVLWDLVQVILGTGSEASLIHGLWTLLVAAVVFELVGFRYRNSTNRKDLRTVLMRVVQGVVALKTGLLILDTSQSGGAWPDPLLLGSVCVLAVEAVILRMRLDGNNLASFVLRILQVGFVVSEVVDRPTANIGLFAADCAVIFVFALLFEGIIFRLRPDPRPPVLEDALGRIQQEVSVYTQLPIGKVKETLGMVRGISDIQADSGLEFELAEQEALYLMLKQARRMGANAVVDARLSIGTYEVNGSKWQVSRPVYTGTAVRI
jgi:uncharacterized protein YbjQ (UPF0145 family)